PVTVAAESDAGLLGAFDEAIDNGRLRILLDLSEIDCLGSAAFGALLRGWTRVHRAGGDVVLASPAPSVTHFLTITRLTGLFKTSETVDEGLEQLRRPGR